MSASPALDLYETGLRGAQVQALSDRGDVLPLPLERFLASSTPEDERLLDHALAPVLDVGCGPGRHVLALQRRGLSALGVDVSPGAVALARGRGAAVRQGSIFGSLPRGWGTVLLLDGNVGIGGSPERLLERVASLLAPHGRVLAELEAPGCPSGPVRLRLQHPGARSEWFSWSRLGIDALPPVAARAGLRVCRSWNGGERWFAQLERAS